jgi:hypothetical protein
MTGIIRLPGPQGGLTHRIRHCQLEGTAGRVARCPRSRPLSTLPAPARDHQPRGLALLPLRLELPRRRSPCIARCTVLPAAPATVRRGRRAAGRRLPFTTGDGEQPDSAEGFDDDACRARNVPNCMHARSVRKTSPVIVDVDSPGGSFAADSRGSCRWLERGQPGERRRGEQRDSCRLTRRNGASDA